VSFYFEQARKIIAEKLGVHTDGIVFTGSGTEGNILAILLLARAHKGTHLIATIAEHTSVHAAMATAQNAGYSITKVS
jgi:cysteine desulfurase